MIEEYIQNNRLKIIVKPNSSKTRITGWDESHNSLRVDVKAKPENNQANIEIIKFFTKLTKKKVRIISGQSSKRKTLEIL